MERCFDRVAHFVLLGLGLAYQRVLFRDGIVLIDGGHLANAVRRVAAGEILCRDIYPVYPPASFHVVAWLFDLLGTRLLVVRGLPIAMTLALAGLAFRLEPFVGLCLAGTAVLLLRTGLGREFVARIGWISIGTLLVLVPIGAHFFSAEAFGSLLRAVFRASFGQSLQAGEFGLLMPALEWIRGNLPTEAAVAGFTVEIDRFLRRRFEPAKRYGQFWTVTRRSASTSESEGGS